MALMHQTIYLFHHPIGRAIMNELKFMVEEVFAALSAMENDVKKNADKTLKQGFGLSKNISDILSEMMYSGDLHIQYYMESKRYEQ